MEKLFLLALWALGLPSVWSDNSIVGTWYLNTQGAPLQISSDRDTLVIESENGVYIGVYYGSGGSKDGVTAIEFNSTTNIFQFCRVGVIFYQWFYGSVEYGLFVGRYSLIESPERPALTNYLHHVTGWNSDELDALHQSSSLTLQQQSTSGIYVSRSWDLCVDVCFFRARLRIDATSPNGDILGRFKVYHSLDGGSTQGEELEYDLNVKYWDGFMLQFDRIANDSSWTETWSGVVSGREISGSYISSLSPNKPKPFSGVRWAVLGYGLQPKSSSDQKQWALITRTQIKLLMMMGDPAPLMVQFNYQNTSVSGEWGGESRDDNPLHWPQDYQLMQWNAQYSLPNPYGEGNVTRLSHGYAAVPSQAFDPENTQLFPVVLACNGHRGSAWQDMFTPNDTIYWFGDGYARRGYVVFAVDLSHRNDSPKYSDYHEGDDPEHGNGPHPSIKYPGYETSDSDWEEDGERAWDVMRALDQVLEWDFVDPTQVIVTGLSMGGEITTFVSALDTRITTGIPAGYSPDMDVVYHHGNHPCWQWLNANTREYIDASDLHSLVAPRTLVVETGQLDTTYSNYDPPFASDKQVARRSRLAYQFDDSDSHNDDDTGFVHYLHYDVHRYHVGDINPLVNGPEPPGWMYVQIPQTVEPPRTQPLSQKWQIDSTTVAFMSMNMTLFDVLS